MNQVLSKNRRTALTIKRALLACGLIALSVACGVTPGPATREAVTARPLGFTSTGSTVFTRPGYDYGASVIQEGNVRKYWWCGFGTTPDGFQSDAIFYRSVNLDTGQASAIQQVLSPRPSVPTWDKSYICDPSVIQGSFLNPDDNATYSYAMYYTATDRGPNSSFSGGPLDGTNNRIGIAYSNDGVNWTRYSNNPVIFPAVFPTDNYGAGQSAVYSENGVSNLRVFYQDNSVNGASTINQRRTSDARNFGAVTPITRTGLAPDGSSPPTGGNMDIAFDSQNRYWYMIHPIFGRTGDREAYGQVLARMPEAAFPGGTWERLGYVDTNLTGDYLVHNAALVRDRFGNVNPTLPNITVIYAGGDNNIDTWDLKQISWTPTPNTTDLRRYLSPNPQSYWVTTGYVAPGFNLEQTLGQLYVGPQPNTVPLYGCQVGSSNDRLLTGRSDCEGQRPLGVNGYLYPTQPSSPATVALYRCYTGSTHFASLQSNCEGATNEGLLGYVLGAGGGGSGAPSLVNPSFETPSVSGLVYRPSGANWSFGGEGGIQRNGSAFGAASAPDGVQTAFLQGSGNGLGAISQSVTFAAGTYTVSFKAARRSGQVQPIRVRVDGTQVGATITPSSDSFATYTSASFTVAAGAHTVALEATDGSGDRTTFVDAVTVQ
jgi:hypothetical protein